MLKLCCFLSIALGFAIAPALQPSGLAQTSCFKWVSCGAYSLWNEPCVPALPLGAYDCQPTGGFTRVCKAQSPACPPAAAAGETGTGKPRCPECFGGKPINFTNGNTYIEESDVDIPGLGGGLKLVRFWNSLWPASQSAYKVGLFGPNWRSNYEERIFLGNDGYLKYARGDGSFWSFGYASSSTWLPAAPANAHAVLTQTSSNWVVTFSNGEQRLFDLNSGNLQSIVDRNGNATQLSYDGLNRLTTVTDPASRHLYFTYATDSSYLVTGISSDLGLSLSYTYDGQGRLLQITKPDQSTLNFQYDANSYITAVEDSAGKVLEAHTYDSSGRGLTGSRANGVEAVTVIY